MPPKVTAAAAIGICSRHIEKKINIDEEYIIADGTHEDATDEDATDEDTAHEDATDEDTRDEETTDEDTADEDTDITSINPDYNFPVFNLINSLHRTSNLNNRNYYISTNEEDEIQEAIRLSLEN